MYHETTQADFSRSDDAGENFTKKNAGITGKAEFKAPFALDPSDQEVCYFGGDALWRSDDRADSWGAITNTLSASISPLPFIPATRTRSTSARRRGASIASSARARTGISPTSPPPT